MYTVERHRLIAAPQAQIVAVLHDLEHLDRLLPRMRQIEVSGRTAGRAHLLLGVRSSRLGMIRLEGEARLLPNGVRFVAVRPVQVDASWTAVERGERTEVVARLVMDLGNRWGPLGRLLPRQLFENKLGRELDRSLDALDHLVPRHSTA